MRALTIDELDYVSGGNVTGPATGENGTKYLSVSSTGELVIITRSGGGGYNPYSASDTEASQSIGDCVREKMQDDWSSVGTVIAGLTGAGGIGELAAGVAISSGAGAGAVTTAAVLGAISGLGLALGAATIGYVATSIADCAVGW